MLTTLPNLLTLSRIAAIPLVIITFYLPSPWGPWIGCCLFALAGFTDWLDGKLARLWEQQSELGRFLDPIADKLLVAAILFMLAALQRVSAPTIFPALVILGREILVSGLREHLATLKVRVPSSRLAKWKTGIQMGAIGVLLVEGWKRGSHAKLEVYRPSLGKPLLCRDDPHIVAVASDAPMSGLAIPQFALDDVAAIAGFILAHCRLKAA